MQRPRLVSVPSYVSSAGQEAIELAALAGLHLDDWQQYVLVNALGERVDGRWAAPTVGLVVGRQNGKNSILEARELAGVFLFNERVIVHSAHEQATSSEHFRRILDLIEGVPEFDSRVLKTVKGKGSEAIELRGGFRILFKTRTGGGGRGFSGDLIVFDEAMILSAAAKAALIPTMAARSMEGAPQTWYAASAVDQLNPKHDGIELSRIRQQGTQGNPNVAYFEWSAEGDDPGNVPIEVARDPAVWAQANPGLGIRIAPDWVEHERTVELGAREFAVERLGIGDWPDPEAGDEVIAATAWAALADPNSLPRDPIIFAFDVSPDRATAAIGAAGRRGDGLAHVEVVDHRPGTGWIVERLNDLERKHHPAAIICDPAGPAGSLVPELEALGLKITVVKTREHAQACGKLFDAVDQAALRHLGTPELAVALRGATRRTVQDVWLWNRRTSDTDIAPLVAVTLAHGGLDSATSREPLVAWV